VLDRIRVHLFGLPRFSIAGRDVPFNARPRVLPLFACLLLERGVPVRRDAIAARLWPDEPQAEGRAALRRHLQYLDSALAGFGVAPSPVVRDGSSIALDAERTPWLDVADFESASMQDDTLAGAVALYRGDLLAPYDDEWIVEARERYRAQHVNNLERLIARARDGGDLPVALGWVDELLRFEPYREDVVRLAMRLRCASGERSRALHEYERYRSLIELELGVEPMLETQMLARAVRDERSDAGRGASALELTSFVGREAELLALLKTARTHRLITLTGPPGVGKSRLAARAAAAISAALSLPLVPVPVGNLERLLRERTIDGPVEAAALHLIDSCEAAIEQTRAFVIESLGSSERTRVLATSRVPLGIAGEIVVRIDPLDAASSAELFVDRAEAMRGPGSIRESDRTLVKAVCGLLDGLPLAIELAAARLASRTLSDVRREIEQPDSDGPFGSEGPLQRAYLASYALLTEEERAVFRRLSAFAGGWTSELARRACADCVPAGGVDAAISKLVEHSLVVAPAPADTAGRYAMLDATRAFAASRCALEGDADRAARAHADAVAARFLPLEPVLRAERAHEYYAEVDREHDNVRAALATLLRTERDFERAAALGLAMSRYWADQGFVAEGVAWLREANVDQLPTSRRLEVLRVIAVMTRNTGDFVESHARFVEIVELTRTQNDAVALAKAETFAANAARLVGAHDEALERIGHAQHIFAAESESYYLAWARYAEACTLLALERIDEAQVINLDVTSAFESLGAAADSAGSLLNLALCHYYAGRIESAQVWIDEALARAEAANNHFYVAHALQNRAAILHAGGRDEDAARSLARSAELAVQLGDKDLSIGCLDIAIMVAGARPARAARFAGAADAARERFHVPRPPIEAKAFARTVTTLRATLAPASFDAHYAHGRATKLGIAMDLLGAFGPDPADVLAYAP
jgi:DNA-binding SARP family transcriptional activator/predicted ATPase